MNRLLAARLSSLISALLLLAMPLDGESVRLADGSVLDADEAVQEGELLHVRLGVLSFYLPLEEGAVLDAPPPAEPDVRGMIEALNNPDPGARRLAVAALSTRVEPEARDAVLAALDDFAPEVRAEAVRTLRDDEEALPTAGLLALIQQDDDTAPRLAAIEALGARGGDLAIERLESLLTDPETSVRQAARAAHRRLLRRR